MSYGGSIINPDEDLVREQERDRREREKRLPLPPMPDHPDGFHDWYEATWWWSRPSPLSFTIALAGMQKLHEAVRAESGRGLDCRTKLIGGPEYGGEGYIYVVSAEEALRFGGVLRKLVERGRLDEKCADYAAFFERAGTRGEGFSFA